MLFYCPAYYPDLIKNDWKITTRYKINYTEDLVLVKKNKIKNLGKSTFFWHFNLFFSSFEI